MNRLVSRLLGAPGTIPLALLLGALTVVGCGGGVITQRDVDEPRGLSTQYGAPKNVHYRALAQVARDALRLTVFQEAECDVLKIRTVARSEETLRDGEVVSRKYVGPIQVSEGTDGVVACQKTFARGFIVAFQVGSASFVLGETSSRGVLESNLSSELRQSLYREQGQFAEALVLVDDPRDVLPAQPAGKVSLAQLNWHEQRVNELVEEMRLLLEKPVGTETTADIARSYELYSQLRQIDAGDARIEGLELRFLEIFYQRVNTARTEQFRRNLKALDEAKNVLKASAADLSGVPLWVQTAAQSGVLNPQILNWSRGQAILGLRGAPGICASGFNWPTTADNLPLSQNLAFHYLRYAYGDPYGAQLGQACPKLTGW